MRHKIGILFSALQILCTQANTMRSDADYTAKIAPKVMIVNFFSSESNTWQERLPSSGLGNLTFHTIPLPGLSPLFPALHCTPAHTICQLVTGEAEINAAASLTALTLAPALDLRATYFLTAGIAGVSPRLGTLGSVALARFAVQVALQYEIDPRELGYGDGAGTGTGYLPFGTYDAAELPSDAYGTEVMEVSAALRDIALGFAARATLHDSAVLRALRQPYLRGPDGDGDEGDYVDPEAGTYAAAGAAPGVLRCDVATSDVYFSGVRLAEGFADTVRIWTGQEDGAASTYCMTAQEDNAVLEALLRAAGWGIVDFGRVMVLRSGSDFDRPAPGKSALENLRGADSSGFDAALENMYLAGVEIVRGILDGWDERFEAGIDPTGYVGDVFGSLGGEPDFGNFSMFNGTGAWGSCA
ncbi:purine nucleoside permease [Xylariaceae sp. FL0016]|nr:purine nucleoside permease [Xylariaceae sp. FL0016]